MKKTTKKPTASQKRMNEIRRRGKAKGREEFGRLGLECTVEAWVRNYRKQEAWEKSVRGHVHDLEKSAELAQTFTGMVSGPADLTKPIQKHVRALLRAIFELKEYFHEECDEVGEMYHKQLDANWDAAQAAKEKAEAEAKARAGKRASKKATKERVAA